MTPIIILFVIAGVNLAVSAFIAVRMYQTLGAVRRESSRAQSLGENIKHEWDSFNRNQSEQFRQRLQEFEDIARRLEESTERRVLAVEELGRHNRTDIQSLQKYVRDVLEVELKSIFDSFDGTMDNMLLEMKDQLVRGVDRIDKLKFMVDSRIAAQQKLIETQGELKRLAEATEVQIEAEAKSAEHAADAAT
jgi:hypothetical protein